MEGRRTKLFKIDEGDRLTGDFQNLRVWKSVVEKVRIPTGVVVLMKKKKKSRVVHAYPLTRI